MANDKRVEIQNAFERIIDNIEKVYFRPMQKDMHECAARCYSNSSSSSEVVSVCVQGCSVRLNEMNKYVTAEINGFQERLQRCVSDCNDEAKDKLGVNSSEKEIEVVSKWFEGCASNCIDKHVSLLPQFMKKVHAVLEKGLAKDSK